MPAPPRRILVITRNYPPQWGGMERLNAHLVQELAHDHRIHLVAPEGAASHAPPGVTVTEVPLRPLSVFFLLALIRSIACALRFRPHLVLAGSGLTAPFTLFSARVSRARAAAYFHGLDVTAPHPIYRTLWRPLFRRLDQVIANSSATAALAHQAGVEKSRISIVHPGVEPAPTDLDQYRRRFREKHGLGSAPVLLSVGRLTERKGIREFVEQSLPLVLESHPQAKFVIVGGISQESLYAAEQSPESILAIARQNGTADAILFLGKLFGTALSEAYAGADIHVFPVRDLPNDPEGFGMVAIEAAEHGLPTVAYATGGVVDAVSDRTSGRLVPAGDARQFASAVRELLQDRIDTELIREHASSFHWAQFSGKLQACLKETR